MRLSVDMLKQAYPGQRQDPKAAAGLAPCAKSVVAGPALWDPITHVTSDELEAGARKERVIERLFAYGHQTGSLPMRAGLAKAFLRSIKSRLTWRVAPKREPDDRTH